MTDIKITQLTEMTSASATDVLPIVDNVATTPETKKITVGNLLSGLDADTVDGYHFPADGWIPAGETWTYASATTFTISGNVTSKYFAGVKIRLTQTTAKYFYVVSSSYSSPNTTVTVTGGTDYTLTNAAISSPYYSFYAIPQGFPDWFNYSPTLTASSGTFTTASVTSALFMMQGNTKFLRARISITTNGTASGAVCLTLPVAYTSTVAVGFGREYSSGGKMIQAELTSNLLYLRNYDNSYPGGNGYGITVSLWYV